VVDKVDDALAFPSSTPTKALELSGARFESLGDILQAQFGIRALDYYQTLARSN
jgi:hypothetical protein